MGAGLWPHRAALGARGWLCLSFCHWRWHGLPLGRLVVVMTKDEALRLALEALETLHDENMDYLTRNKLGGENNQCMVFAREAITAIKAALEAKDKPIQEPAAWISKHNVVYPLDAWHEVHPINELKPLYTTPPQRTWVGLTDEEIDKAWRSVDYTVPWDQHRIDIARAIETKLKEKNT